MNKLLTDKPNLVAQTHDNIYETAKLWFQNSIELVWTANFYQFKHVIILDFAFKKSNTNDSGFDKMHTTNGIIDEKEIWAHHHGECGNFIGVDWLWIYRCDTHILYCVSMTNKIIFPLTCIFNRPVNCLWPKHMLENLTLIILTVLIFN